MPVVLVENIDAAGRAFLPAHLETFVTDEAVELRRFTWFKLGKFDRRLGRDVTRVAVRADEGGRPLQEAEVLLAFGRLEKPDDAIPGIEETPFVRTIGARVNPSCFVLLIGTLMFLSSRAATAPRHGFSSLPAPNGAQMVSIRPR